MVGINVLSAVGVGLVRVPLYTMVAKKNRVRKA